MVARLGTEWEYNVDYAYNEAGTSSPAKNAIPNLAWVCLAPATTAAASARFMTPDPKQRMFDPQPWNVYQYSRNNPTTMVDPDGREITVAAELQKSYDHLMKSQSFRSAIAPYQGKGNPNLTIQRGTLGFDPMEPNRKDLGNTKTSIVPSIQNCSSATPAPRFRRGLKGATITIDNSVGEGKGKEQKDAVTNRWRGGLRAPGRARGEQAA